MDIPLDRQRKGARQEAAGNRHREQPTSTILKDNPYSDAATNDTFLNMPYMREGESSKPRHILQQRLCKRWQTLSQHILDI